MAGLSHAMSQTLKQTKQTKKNTENYLFMMN